MDISADRSGLYPDKGGHGLAQPRQRREPFRPAPGSPAGERLFYLDACRAVFVLLGVVLHAVAPFAADQPWLMDAPRQSGALFYVFQFIHAFRMPAFFVIAGFFAALVLARRGVAPWLQGRAMRLGVPLAFAVLFVMPVESLVFVFGNRLTDGAFGPVPDAGVAGLLAAAAERHMQDAFYWVGHMWFVLDLLLLSLAFAAFYLVVGPTRVAAAAAAVGDALARPGPVLRTVLGTVALVGLAAYLVVVYRIAFGFPGAWIVLGGEQTMWHILDGGRLARYAPFFGLGLLLFHSPAFLGRFVRLPPAGWAAGIAVVAVYLVVRSDPSHWTVSIALGAPAAVLLTRMALHVASLLLDRPNRVVQWFAEGSYTIYIVHNPIVILLVPFVVLAGLGPVTGFIVTLTGAAALSAAIFAVTRRLPVATLLLNGIAPRRAAA